MSKFHKIFKKSKPIIGVIHFPPLLGYKNYHGFEYIKNKTFNDLKALEQGGVDAILLENNYDIPHRVFVEPETIAQMTLLAKLVREKTKLPLGIIVLWNDYKASLSIAKIVGAQFIRLPVFVDKVRTSYGKIIGEPKKVIAYQKKIGAEDIAIFTDIQVKHAKMLEKKDLATSAKQAIKAGSDGLIITGEWTGDAPRLEAIKKVKKSVADFPVLIGSGITDKNIKKFFRYVDGAIVGTFFKTGKYLDKKQEINIKGYKEIIDIRKVKSLVSAAIFLPKNLKIVKIKMRL